MKTSLTIILLFVTLLINAQMKPVGERGGSYAELSSFAGTDKSKAIDFIHAIGILNRDYVWERDTISLLGSNFSSLTDPSKDIVGIYCAKDINTLIAYYMSQGMSQTDATMYYLERRITDIQHAGQGYCNRINKPILQAYILIFIGESQAIQFNDQLRNYKSDLCSIALVGSMYGDSKEGIMDYIESTGSYSTGGLKNYTMSAEMVALYGSQDNARLALITILKDIIINGK